MLGGFFCTFLGWWHHNERGQTFEASFKNLNRSFKWKKKHVCKTWNEGLVSVLLCRTHSWMASVAFVKTNYDLLPLTQVLFLRHDWPDSAPLCDWQAYVCCLHPTSLLPVDSMPPQIWVTVSTPVFAPCSHVWPPCPGCCSRTRRRTTKQCSPVRRGALGGPILSR